MSRKIDIRGLLLIVTFILCITLNSCSKEPMDENTSTKNDAGDNNQSNTQNEVVESGEKEIQVNNEWESDKLSTIPDIYWRIAPTKYETKDIVVMGYDIRDFGVEPNTGEDVTNKIQAAMLLLNRYGGGTLFLSEGEYVVKGNLNIPKGVTICGDWQNPLDNPELKGTVLLAYAGRGKNSGTPFITLQPNSCLRDLSIWYPEQTVEDIVSYPPSVCLYDPSVWGADYTHVQNLTFVDSYRAIQQGPNGNASPNINNIYGTPLSIGLSIDGSVDIGRSDFIYFSPEIWENSGLIGAPTKESGLRDYLYENAVGISAGRVDWSYFTNTKIIGYAVGMKLREGELGEQGNFPNGQVYRHQYLDCKVGILVEGVANVGESFADITIDNCEIGIKLINNKKTLNGYIQIANSNISAKNYAVYNESGGELSLLQTVIEKGAIYSSQGTIVVSGCEIETSGNQITLAKNSNGMVLNGVNFAQEMKIDNQAQCRILVDTKRVEPIEIAQVPDLEKVISKPARAELYVAQLDGTDKSDITEELQKLLAKAGNEGGGIVFVPPGEYSIYGNVTIPTGVELKGAIDIGRNPIRIGTIFRVRSKEVGKDGIAVVNLEANSGIRGIVFDYPEQDFTKPKEYPYTIRGNGEHIYIINVSLRGAYNGVDLMTNRCDNHYVEYLSGICLNNVLKVGGGASGGKIFNMQVNYICISAGDESKFGSWDNSPTGDTKEKEQKILLKYLQENLVVMLIGDVTEQLLFDNFSYNGNVGVKFIEENGKGASGYCVGQGVDYSSRAFDIEKLLAMQFINTQVVSYKEDFNIDNDVSHFVLRDTVDSTVEFINISGWAKPVSNARVEGGKLKLYNARFCSTPDIPLHVLDKGSLEIVNLSLDNGNDLNLAKGNLDNILITGLVYNRNLINNFGKLVGEFKRNVRFSLPSKTLNDDANGVYLFAENFENYPVMNSNGVNDVMQPTDNFREFQAPSTVQFTSILKENSNSYGRMYCDDTGMQTYMKSDAMIFTSEKQEGKYIVEMKLRFTSMSTGKEAKVFCGMKGAVEGSPKGSELLFQFNSDKTLEVNNKSVSAWDIGRWYYVVIQYDLSKETKRSYEVFLYSEDGKQLGSSRKQLIRDDLQKGNISLGDYQLGTIGGMGQKSGAVDVNIDYIVVY